MSKSNLHKMARHYKLTGTTTVSTASTKSAAHCLQLCISDGTCKSVNFEITTSTCALLVEDYASAGVTLVCDEDFTHVTVDGNAMPNYIKSKDMACQIDVNGCSKTYQQCTATCVANQWVGACTANDYKDCKEAYAMGERRSGVYSIKPDAGAAFEVFCDMKNHTHSDGLAGYTVVLRRNDGSVDFKKTLAEFTNLIGNLDGEFYIGNENLRRLTATPRVMFVVIWPFEGEYEVRYEKYNTFSLGASPNYALSALFYSGTAGDILRSQNSDIFRTTENDAGGCSNAYGPNWHANNPCHEYNPFGTYLYGWNGYHMRGITWNGYTGYYYSFRATEWRIY